MNNNSSIKKLIRNFVFFIALILLTLWIILKDQSITEIVSVFDNVKVQFVLIGIICMIIYIFLEGYNIRRTLKELGHNISIIRALKYSLIGFFFSGITPAASGGQPMQIYYMHKDNIPVASSTLALLINLASMQIATITIALVSLLFNYRFMNQVLIILFVVGIILNMSALSLLLIGIFSRRLSRLLIKLTVKIMIFFHAKKIWKKKRKLLEELKSYHLSAKYIRNNKKLIIKILATTFVQFLIYYSTAYWTYRSLGFREYNIVQITTMQSVLFATVSSIPSPGSVGVSEGAFIEIFRNAYPTSMIKSATLLHRAINFYMFILISGIVVIVNDIKSKRNEEVVKGEEK